jgi:zinc/manganese transport system permease protein
MSITAVVQLLLPSFALCVLMVGMLSYLGIHVVKREIIFVDLALAQIAALGALVGFLLGIPLHTQGSYWFSVALTAIAAAVFTLSRTRESRVPQEAIIGLVYAIAAGTAIILIDKAPHGAEHIKDILTGSILWVKWQTVAVVAVVYAAVGALHFAFRDRFLLISEDPDAARARGLRLGLWDFLFYLTFGFVITVSVGSAGVLLVFVFLVAPAVMALTITDRFLYQLMFGWVLGIVATVSGLVISYVGDLSSGPMVIGAYAIALVIVSAAVRIVRSPNRPAAVRQTSVIALAFAVCFAALYFTGRALGARYRDAGHVHGHAHGIDVSHEHGEEDAGDHDAARPAHGGSVEEGSTEHLSEMFGTETDVDVRADILVRLLHLDAAAGAPLALEFLAEDPPLFFAQSVVDELDAHLSAPSGIDVTEPFDSPGNQEAAARVRLELGLSE